MPDSVACPRAIKMTGPPILELARQVAHNHLMASAEPLSHEQISDRVAVCVSTMATWPESLTILYLLRDLEPEDFYNA